MSLNTHSETTITEITGPKRTTKLLKGIGRQEREAELLRRYQILPKEERRRLDHFRSEFTIIAALNNLIARNNRLPTVLEIEAETTLSRTTIYKHLKGFKSVEFLEEHNQMIQKLRKSAIEKLYAIGVTTNNVRAIEAFLKHTDQTEPKAHREPKYLQLNNTYIDQRTIQLLPPSTLLEIEKLLQNAIPKADESVQNEKHTEEDTLITNQTTEA